MILPKVLPRPLGAEGVACSEALDLARLRRNERNGLHQGNRMRLRRRTHGSVSTEGLLSRLSHVHPDLDGLQIFQVMRDTPHGITLRARRLGEAWSVAIKLYGGPDGTAKAGRCYDQHRHAFSLLQSNPRLSVPEPLAQFDEPAGYAMRYVAGRSGDAMLRRAIFRRQRTAGELVDRAARWLRAFHLSSGLHPAPLAPRGSLHNSIAASTECPLVRAARPSSRT